MSALTSHVSSGRGELHRTNRLPGWIPFATHGQMPRRKPGHRVFYLTIGGPGAPVYGFALRRESHN